mgnify:CR=1 FL=1
MLPDWPHDNNGCCFIMSQLAQWRPPRKYTEILNSNLPSGKSMVNTVKNYIKSYTHYTMANDFVEFVQDCH